jgi:exonuclease SbcD
MRIIHTSDIRLGASFIGLKLAGDRLRAGLKLTFSKIIDYTLSEKADILIIAGNLFDNIDISKNFQDYIAGEIGKLNDIPAVILPGQLDNHLDGSFWKSWDSLYSLKNVFVMDNPKNPFVRFERLNCTVYGFPWNRLKDSKAIHIQPVARQNTKYHIAVIFCPSEYLSTAIEKSGLAFDYIALGGEPSFKDLTSSGINAAYSGAPEQLAFDQQDTGSIARVEIGTQNQPIISKIKIGSFNWHILELKAKEILNNDDLINKLKPLAGPDVLLRLKLTGLALFESSLEPEYVQQLMKGEFLYLDIIDDMKVLPGNISEIKISEKAILGQYIKLMAQKLNDCDENLKPQLEKSLKTGYALLQGRGLR